MSSELSFEINNNANLTRRKVLTGATGVVGAIGTTFVAVPFVASWMPSDREKAAGAPVYADISQLQFGQMLTVLWRGRPVWVVRRTPEMLERLATQTDHLADPGSQKSDQPDYAQNELRAVKDEFLVMIGICTHLGCAPMFRPALNSPDMAANWQGGFFCPCHGSSFDLAGRVFKGMPAPTNLPIPPHFFVTDTKISVGEDPKEGGVV